MARATGTGGLFRRAAGAAWVARWREADGRRVERSTRTTERAAALRLLSKWTGETALRRDGVIDARAEAVQREARRPIEETLAAWRQALESKGVGAKRLSVALGRARRMLAGAATLADLGSARVEAAMAELRSQGAAPRTINGHVQAARQLVRWAMATGRLASNPLAGIASAKVVGQTFTRRPLGTDELARLIEAAASGPAFQRLGPGDRAMLYRLAVGTGLRAGELASLTPASFDLASEPPAIAVKAAYSKRRRDDRQPIRRDLADTLRPWLATKPAGAPVLAMPARTADMIRSDLRRARALWLREGTDPAERRRRNRSDFLAVVDSEGRVADFHALRGSFITLLVKSGASVKEAQELARHSDPKLTLGVYARLGVHDLSGALDRMPTIGTPGGERERLRATGTDHARPSQHQGPPGHPRPEPRPITRVSMDADERTRTGSANSLRATTEPKSRSPERLRAPADADGLRRTKATHRIRTGDLCFTKALLYR